MTKIGWHLLICLEPCQLAVGEGWRKIPKIYIITPLFSGNKGYRIKLIYPTNTYLVPTMFLPGS